jgi:hypothetical protein
MRIALIVGIDCYQHIDQLFGCVNDAHSVKSVLERHADGSVNFDCQLMTGVSADTMINRSSLKDMAEQLFAKSADIALFYFAGHGSVDATGGYLLCSDARRADEGLSLNDILVFANKSKAKNKIIILDSCHSGFAGSFSGNSELASLAAGVTVLTASSEDQYASEEDGRGVFTTLLVDALSGSAANLTGSISPGSVYAHIDQSLGGWEQRPVFKTNVQEFISLRNIQPAIALNDLRLITTFFPSPGFEFDLDPTFEPEMKGRDADMPPPDIENTKQFAVLQKYNRLNLLVPVDCEHMWTAAMESKSCKLTALGEHYRRLVEKNRI